MDNDCDLQVDEDFPDCGQACGAGLGECRRDGVVRCTPDGRTSCDATAAPPQAECCNARDDDCDGAVDEDLAGCCEPDQAEPCGTDEGGCTVGRRLCGAGRVWGACDGIGPAPEVCNGLDDDCDGSVDDGFDLQNDARHCGACGHACNNGGCENGRCSADVFQVMVCGDCLVDVRDDFLGPLAGRNVEVVTGCVPGPETGALLVTRWGVVDAGIEPFVARGGVVVTEYSSSDMVFNAVFRGAGVVDGRNYGHCGTTVVPVVVHSPDDWFWIQTGTAVVTLDASGCGFDVAAYPGITRLGGWNDDMVSLAYRDHGEGRVWLAETNWQDNNPQTLESRRLMGFMIGWSFVPPPSECGDGVDDDVDGVTDYPIDHGCVAAGALCETGQTCDGACVDLRSDPDHSGACDRPCADGPWRFYCFDNGPSFTCATACTIGEIRTGHSPCNCQTQGRLFATWCLQD